MVVISFLPAYHEVFGFGWECGESWRKVLCALRDEAFCIGEDLRIVVWVIPCYAPHSAVKSQKNWDKEK